MFVQTLSFITATTGLFWIALIQCETVELSDGYEKILDTVSKRFGIAFLLAVIMYHITEGAIFGGFLKGTIFGGLLIFLRSIYSIILYIVGAIFPLGAVVLVTVFATFHLTDIA
jgi:hypothetical protein